MEKLDLDEEYKSFLDDTAPLRIVCISDTHRRHKWLSDVIPNGDLLIHCGDITFQGMGGVEVLSSFNQWIGRFPHRHKVVIGGNHDQIMDAMNTNELKKEIFTKCHYLQNEVLIIPEFGNLTLFGTGWSPKGSGNNAFHRIEEEMVRNLKRQKIDILIGHWDLTKIGKHNDSRDIVGRNVISAVK